MAHIAIDARLWTKTGVGRYIRNLVQSLAENPNSKIHTFSILAIPEDIPSITHLPTNFKIIPCNYYWHSLGEQLGFAKFLNGEKFDLVHFTYSPSPLFYKGKFIITIHDLIMVNYKTGRASTLPYPLYLAKHETYKRLLSRSIKNSQKIIVPTNTVKKEILSRFTVVETKIAVTYEGFDKKIKSTPLLHKEIQKGKYFLYVGNAYPHKNLEVLLAAFDLFQKDNSGYKLILVGSSDYFYTRLLSGNKNIKNVIHLTDVDDPELSSLYSNATAFVSASRNEGFGLPALESLSHSTPVLLSDIPVFHEIIGDVAVYFDSSNPKDLAKQMEFVVKHRDALHEKAENIQNTINQNFSWSILAQQTLDIYESCIGL